MKTIEEKAKAYDEALERAKGMRALPADKATVEYIFPELAESEDERIRKGLIKMLERAAGSSVFEATGIKKDALLAYLEKQKEQSIPWYDYKKSKEAGYTIVPNEEYERLIKQKEQKPSVDVDPCDASWDAYYQRGLNKGYELGLEAGRKEQKPAWSQEDEWRIDAICELLENTSAIHPNYSRRKLIIWLKSLCPPFKSSEEDERILKGIIGKIDHDQAYGVSKAEMLSFLKRLRPSWKPSEEQLAVLLNAEGLMRANDYKENAKILAEVIEQLKKL